MNKVYISLSIMLLLLCSLKATQPLRGSDELYFPSLSSWGIRLNLVDLTRVVFINSEDQKSKLDVEMICDAKETLHGETYQEVKLNRNSLLVGGTLQKAKSVAQEEFDLVVSHLMFLDSRENLVYNVYLEGQLRVVGLTQPDDQQAVKEYIKSLSISFFHAQK